MVYDHGTSDRKCAGSHGCSPERFRQEGHFRTQKNLLKKIAPFLGIASHAMLLNNAFPIGSKVNRTCTLGLKVRKEAGARPGEFS